MNKVIIAAVAKNRVIGKDNNLIWRLPADMKFFRDQTTGFPVIMGRRNYESIPAAYRPLRDRTNIVVSRSSDLILPGCVVVNSLKEAILWCEEKAAQRLFIIGGGQIYKLALEQNLADEMLLTEVDASPEGDTWFPDFDRSQWVRTLIQTQEPDDKHQYGFKIYRYKRVGG